MSTWVVTGAGSGIGRATALAAAKTGARVAALDVNAARLAELKTDLGDRALLVKEVDVADRAAMKAFADEVHSHVAAVDVIVNNAGVAVGGNFLDTSLDDWDWLVGINLKGVVHGCHYFIPRMVARERTLSSSGAEGRRGPIDRRQGHVINIASIFGIHAPPGVSAYCASKFGVLGMTRSLRSELAPHGVGVTAICPGMIDTSIVADGRLAGKPAARRPAMVARFKKGLPPAAVASAILDAVRTNPAVRTVGKDAWALHQLTRLLPTAAYSIGAKVAQRLDAL
jgi:NAD(P)-dependent dehydrogenase (short-subunit alcohol dehydrogenase family)